MPENTPNSGLLKWRRTAGAANRVRPRKKSRRHFPAAFLMVGMPIDE